MKSGSNTKVRQVNLTAKLNKRLLNSNQPHKRDIHLFEKLSKLESILGIKAKYYKSTKKSIKDFSVKDIPLCQSLIIKHPFAKYIKKTDSLSSKDFNLILNKIKFSVYVYKSGVIPAAFNPATDYSEHSWTRDTAIIAYSLAISKHFEESKRAIKSLAVFYARKEQRDRFISFHYHDDPFSKYRFGNPTLELPHVRARIDENGDMVESPQDWSHSQLDAIGMWIFSTFKMANLGIIDLTELDSYLTNEVNSDNALDSILAVGIKFLNRIKFWHQHDHGPWEDRLEPSRASSVGIGIAALKEVKKYFEKYGHESLNFHSSDQLQSLNEEIGIALQEAGKVLEFRIPLSGEYAIETESYQSDSALSFLLYPFNPGLNTKQGKAIIRTLYTNRMGVVGFSRRDHDEYLGQDYIYNSQDACFCEPSQPFYRAAQWTMFDPLLAAYYYQRYLDSNAMDKESFSFADRHLKRTLLTITKSKDSYRKAYCGNTVSIPSNRIPEAYFYDSKLAKWRANHNAPLLMAEAAFAFMADRAASAIKLWEMSQK